VTRDELKKAALEKQNNQVIAHEA